MSAASGTPRATRRAVVTGTAVMLAMVSGCRDDVDRSVPPGPKPGVPHGGVDPAPVGTPSLGPMVADLRPSAKPRQVGPSLRGMRMPSNQWWTSALTGPWTQPLWAVPVMVQATADGLVVAVPPVRVQRDHVVSDAAPQLVVGGRLRSVRVEAFGDFSVRLGLTRADGSRLGVDLAQGSPVIHLEVPAGTFELVSRGSSPSVEPGGELRVQAGGRTWQVLAGAGTQWAVEGLRATATLSEDGTIALAPRPDGAGAAWDAALAVAASAPVTDTVSTLAVDRTAGTATQSLRWVSGGVGLVVTTPVQRTMRAPDADVLGTYPTARGELHVLGATRLDLATPLRVPPSEVADLDLDSDQRSAVAADLRLDLDDSTVGGGIYDDAKALGRLALLADVARHLSGPEADGLEEQALALLGAGLRDWLTYQGAADGRWLAYEPAWGTVAAYPAQFGSQDLNDHHFQFGYLIRAAATLQRLTGGDARGLDADACATIDLLVADVIGAGASADQSHLGDLTLPRFRVWNAYLGHSAASGFAPFADGNNQESSSEAIHAWEAIADWARVIGDEQLLDAAVARYCFEAVAARTLWLGEGVDRPAGYQHQVVGIVWDGKLDFATFFDGRPEAVIGIQLLPFTPGSVYRDDSPAAADRVAAARTAGGGNPRLWPDLFLMESAIADPPVALAALGREVPMEAGNSRAWMRWWVLSQQDSD